MKAANKRLTILSEAAKAALYDIPDFDGEQRLTYLNLSAAELALVNSRPGLVDKVHCAIQIGYFKAKDLFFRLTWENAQEDIVFILREYFQNSYLPSITITDYEYYAKYKEIASLFNYQRYSKDNNALLKKQIKQILYRDVNIEFIIMELISFLKEKKIIRPGYTTLQTIIGEVLKKERDRLNKIIHSNLNKLDKSAINYILNEHNNLFQLTLLDSINFPAHVSTRVRV